MPDTEDEEAAATERWLDQLDPATVEWRDARWLRAIMAVDGALDGAEDALRRAVATARAAGDSWTVIGAALGTTAEVARQRFGDADSG
jgi:hypothetical protein